MARFSDNPTKTPLSGAEDIPATDPGTGDDVKFTPIILTQFAQDNMTVAAGAQQGLVSGPNGDKLEALYTKAQIDALFAQVGQVAFPIFIGTPVDGTIEIFRNVLSNTIEFEFMWYALSSGSTTMSILIDGTPVTGWNGVAVTNSSDGATATNFKTLPAGSILSMQFAASGAPQNLRASLKGHLQLT